MPTFMTTSPDADLPSLQAAFARIPRLVGTTVGVVFDRTNAYQLSIDVVRPDGVADPEGASHARGAFHDWRRALRRAGLLTLRVEIRFTVPKQATVTNAAGLAPAAIAELTHDLDAHATGTGPAHLDVLLTARPDGLGASIEAQPIPSEDIQRAMYQSATRWTQRHQPWFAAFRRGVFLLAP